MPLVRSPGWPTSSRSARSATPRGRPARRSRRAALRPSARGAERAARASPYNVVHLTLPDSAEEARTPVPRLARRGRARADDEQPPGSRQDYVGPDGVAPRAPGPRRLARAEPYETRRRPAARADAPADPRRSGCGSCARRASQLEPIFLLVRRAARRRPPDEQPDLEVERHAALALPDADAGAFAGDAQLLIADGHHRYETALDLRRGGAGAARG